jgi:hypothetical protein
VSIPQDAPPPAEVIPFEQAVLDTALAEVIQRLLAEAEVLDDKRQIVDELTCTVDRKTLVAVRMLKNKQQELLDRVTVVKDQLEHTAGAPLWPHPRTHGRAAAPPAHTQQRTGAASACMA